MFPRHLMHLYFKCFFLHNNFPVSSKHQPWYLLKCFCKELSELLGHSKQVKNKQLDIWSSLLCVVFHRVKSGGFFFELCFCCCRNLSSAEMAEKKIVGHILPFLIQWLKENLDEDCLSDFCCCDSSAAGTCPGPRMSLLVHLLPISSGSPWQSRSWALRPFCWNQFPRASPFAVLCSPGWFLSLSPWKDIRVGVEGGRDLLSGAERRGRRRGGDTTVQGFSRGWCGTIWEEKTL